MIKLLSYDKEITIEHIQLLLNKQDRNSYEQALIDDWTRTLSVYLSQFKVYSDICIPCQSRRISIKELYNHLDLNKLLEDKQLTIDEIEFIFDCLKDKYR